MNNYTVKKITTFVFFAYASVECFGIEEEINSAAVPQETLTCFALQSYDNSVYSEYERYTETTNGKLAQQLMMQSSFDTSQSQILLEYTELSNRIEAHEQEQLRRSFPQINIRELEQQLEKDGVLTPVPTLNEMVGGYNQNRINNFMHYIFRRGDLGNVLEIGSGACYTTARLLLLPSVNFVHAVEMSAPACQKGLEVIKEYNVFAPEDLKPLWKSGRFKITRGDFLNPKIKFDRPYKTVLAMHVFHYNKPSHVIQMLTKIRFNMDTDSRLYLSVNMPCCDTGWFEAYLHGKQSGSPYPGYVCYKVKNKKKYEYRHIDESYELPPTQIKILNHSDKICELSYFSFDADTITRVLTDAGFQILSIHAESNYNLPHIDLSEAFLEAQARDSKATIMFVEARRL